MSQSKINLKKQLERLEKSIIAHEKFIEYIEEILKIDKKSNSEKIDEINELLSIKEEWIEANK